MVLKVDFRGWLSCQPLFAAVFDKNHEYYVKIQHEI